MLFSQRQGILSVRQSIQLEGMDDDLRNGLWDVLVITVFEEVEFQPYEDGVRASSLAPLFTAYWHSLLKQPLDRMPTSFERALAEIRNLFFTWAWYGVYDLIEFTGQNLGDAARQARLWKFANKVLERELSGYRFVGGHLVPITSESEIESIELALKDDTLPAGARLHFQAALGRLADRKNPDFRNSIKESVSAVEAQCQALLVTQRLLSAMRSRLWRGVGHCTLL